MLRKTKSKLEGIKFSSIMMLLAPHTSPELPCVTQSGDRCSENPDKITSNTTFHGKVNY